jgi:sulfur relay (sulfurtransferase) complex TusBCD TusD component (DsrE family)
MGERDFKEDELLDGVAVGTMDVIAEYTARADRVLTF